MLFSNPDKKIRKASNEMLQMAEKIFAYREDILPEKGAMVELAARPDGELVEAQVLHCSRGTDGDPRARLGLGLSADVDVRVLSGVDHSAGTPAP